MVVVVGRRQTVVMDGRGSDLQEVLETNEDGGDDR